MKIAVGLIVLVTFCGVLYAQSHHMEWGNRTHHDLLLQRDFVRKNPLRNRIVSTIFSYPLSNSTKPRNRTITYIRAQDQHRNGRGGHATLGAGGVGFNHTAVHFNSQKSEGFDFILEIYGY